MNSFYIDRDGSLRLKLGPLEISSYSQLEYEEDDVEFDVACGFTDIYLDVYGLGLYHIGLGSGPTGSRFQFSRLEY